MNEPLSPTQLVIAMERVGVETGLRVSQVMEVMQRLSHHITLMVAEAEFAAAEQALQPKAPCQGSH